MLYLDIYNLEKPNDSRVKLFIKYMVSKRCKLMVKAELKKLGLHVIAVHLGEIEIGGYISPKQREQLKTALSILGLELIDDKRAVLVEKIKTAVIEMVHYTDEPRHVKFSSLVSKTLDCKYPLLSKLFSDEQGLTIEQFIILHKIERAKELIMYDELTITQISFKLNYSSVAHLSSQFKKVTGLTPTHFKKIKNKRRTPIEEIGVQRGKRLK